MNLTPRAIKVIKAQRLIILLSILGVPTLLYHLAGKDLQGFWWIPFIIGTYILTRLTVKALVWCSVMVIYNFDVNLMYEEAEEMAIPPEGPAAAPREELQLTVVAKPEAPVGRYYDEDIWEWVEFVDQTGRKLIGKFEDTISPKQMGTFVIPDEHALFPPGILYKLELKIAEAV